jgi:ABC-type multidrug transport system fused ATPase/permease subunit
MAAKAFDTHLFKRILKYTKPYKLRYYGVILFAISLSVFAALRPYLLKQTVDEYIAPKDKYGLLFYVTIMGVVLLLETFSQFFFVFWANLLGQDIIKDIRVKLFKHMLSFILNKLPVFLVKDYS